MIANSPAISKNDRTSTLIIGLGNPILGDDGIGWSVAQEIENQLSSLDTQTHLRELPKNLQIIKLSLGGLRLMEMMIGFDYAILIDAISTGTYPPGTIVVFPLNQLPNHSVGHLTSSHDTSLQNALKIGRSLGTKLPDKITVVGIEIDITYDFSDELSEPINASIPEATKKVMELIL